MDARTELETMIHRAKMAGVMGPFTLYVTHESTRDEMLPVAKEHGIDIVVLEKEHVIGGDA